MSEKNFSTRDSAGTLSATDVVPVWKAGQNVKTTMADVATYVAAQSASYAGSFAGTHTGNAVLAGTSFSIVDMTETGNVPSTASMVYLNHATVAIEAAIVPSAGVVRIIAQKDAGTAGHTLTTAGTFDGTNNTATFDAQHEALVLLGLSSTRWAIISNVGSVALSNV